MLIGSETCDSMRSIFRSSSLPRVGDNGTKSEILASPSIDAASYSRNLFELGLTTVTNEHLA